MTEMTRKTSPLTLRKKTLAAASQPGIGVLRLSASFIGGKN